MKKWIALSLVLVCALLLFSGCQGVAVNNGSTQDADRTIDVGATLQSRQPTPTDIDYSLERYNLIRRAYWVNGQREKARNLPCPLPDVPLGYVVLLTDNGGVVSKFIVEGKVSSLLNYLTPISEWYEQQYWGGGDSYEGANDWLADVDGTYGSNDDGIFFFTPDGKYVEWSGTYLYSDIPFEISDPVVKYSEVK